MDTTSRNLISIVPDTVFTDSTLHKSKPIATKKITKRKRVQKSKIKEEVLSSQELISDNLVEHKTNFRPIIIGFLIIAVLLLLKLYRPSFSRDNKQKTNISDSDEYISDFISRMTLPRRLYYRNVYLKSEAWKRKRFVVLKRDNWRCVYCGERATQVHHTRYAKRNIGKEPIEWLVSICKKCHESIHS